jgi:hypothetical protein
VAELFALMGGLLLLVGAAAWAMMREDARLRGRARRYRQLELEGIEELRRTDPYPEHAPVRGAFLREPDGSPVDADSVLHEELERVREHTRRVSGRRSRTRSLRRGKGASCLV